MRYVWVEQELKAKLTARLLEALYQQLPQAEGHVSFCELGTPLSNNTFLGATRGEVYGVPHTPARFRQVRDLTYYIQHCYV